MLTETAGAITNRTISNGDIAKAQAVLDLARATSRMLGAVPKAGMGSLPIRLPMSEFWTGEITRGEVGCGDHNRFELHVVCARDGAVLVDLTSEIVLVARRCRVQVELPGITSAPGLNQNEQSKIHDAVLLLVRGG